MKTELPGWSARPRSEGPLGLTKIETSRTLSNFGEPALLTLAISKIFQNLYLPTDSLEIWYAGPGRGVDQ